MNTDQRDLTSRSDQPPMTRSTPGPWRKKFAAYTDEGEPFFHIVAGPNSPQLPVADCVWEGDAHLIAAAPDLLAALQWLVSCTDMSTRPEGCADAVRAALAKANAA